MITLSLNIKSKGYYSKEVGSTRIELSNPSVCAGSGSNAWQLIITEEDVELFNEWFNTKKEAMKAGTKFVTNNL